MPPESALASGRESAHDWVSGPFDLSGDDDDGASTDDRESADDAIDRLRRVLYTGPHTTASAW